MRDWAVSSGWKISRTGLRMSWRGSSGPQLDFWVAASLALEAADVLVSSVSPFFLRPFFILEPLVPARGRLERPARRDLTRSLA